MTRPLELSETRVLADPPSPSGQTTKSTRSRPLADSTAVDPTEGTDDLDKRFVHRTLLGSGAMGSVFRAFDKTRRDEIALKYLDEVDPDALYRFKQEFRLLVGLVHPNVVMLHELVNTGNTWAVAMELVDHARPFLDYVRPYLHTVQTPAELPALRAYTSDSERNTPVGPHLRDRPILDESTRELPPITANGSTTDSATAVVPAPHASLTTERIAILAAEYRQERLCSALLQLVDGLEFIHQHGILHRDIKSSNVLVDGTGRVVVCDFGLVTAAHVDEGNVVGTPAYMSPEQAERAELTAASDLYSVGVMLYEALTGHLPVDAASLRELLASKRQAHIRPPRAIDPTIHPQLEALCLALLDREPERRPDTTKIREILRTIPVSTPGSTPSAWARGSDRDLFIGREQERADLHRAFADARAGQTVAVLISGPSGVGKSALVAQACEELHARHDAVVFHGRCYQTESVPFKAIDAVVDAIANHLLTVPAERAAALLPSDDETAALAELFAVLRRVTAVAHAVERHAQPLPPNLMRPTAQLALQKLVHALAIQRPVVIAIDDLQWGDLDSAPMLRGLIEGRGSPGVLLLATYRDGSELPEGATHPELITALSEPSADGLATRRDIRHLGLAPLTREDATELVLAIAGERCPKPQALDQILDDAGGNPMFVAELAHAAAEGRRAAASEGLDALIEHRIETLPVESRHLLEAAATAAWPQPLALLSRALDIEHETTALTTLLAARMVRLVRSPDDGPDDGPDRSPSSERLTTYHDRVRRAVLEFISEPRRRRLHTRLARAFEAAPEPDIEALALHWAGAGDKERAGHYALRAGRRALAARAYHRAAAHLARALSTGALDHDTRDEVELERAEALSLAGSMERAADIYCALAQRAPPERTSWLWSQAFACLVHASKMERARDLIRTTGRGLGVKIPRTRGAALLSIAWGRLLLALCKARRLRLRAVDAISAAQRRQLDMAMSVATALSHSDATIGFAVHTRYILDAIGAGDPHHIAISFGQESIMRTFVYGARNDRETHELLARAARAAEATNNAAYDSYVDACRGMCCYLTMTRLREVVEPMRAACDRMAHQPELVRYTDVLYMATISGSGLAGAFSTLCELLPLKLEQLQASGNEYMVANICRQTGIYLYLAHDQPERVRHALDYARPADTPGVTIESWDHRVRLAELEAYEGQWEAATQQIHRLWTDSKGTSLAIAPLIICTTASILGRMSATMATHDRDARHGHLARARAMKGKLDRLRAKLPHYASGHAAMVGAVIAAAQGDLDATAVHLREAVECFDTCQVGLHGVPARLQLGHLLGGDEGRRLEDEALTWMKAEGIVRPDRFARWQCPIDLVLESR
ncbi:MAG: protein kinase [Myxococcota bacterium]